MSSRNNKNFKFPNKDWRKSDKRSNQKRPNEEEREDNSKKIKINMNNRRHKPHFKHDKQKNTQTRTQSSSASPSQTSSDSNKKGVVELPGYYYDEELNRYFKIDKNHKPPVKKEEKHETSQNNNTQDKSTNVSTSPNKRIFNLLRCRELGIGSMYPVRVVESLYASSVPSNSLTGGYLPISFQQLNQQPYENLDINNIQMDMTKTHVVTSNRTGEIILYKVHVNELTEDNELSDVPYLRLARKMKERSVISAIRWCPQELPLFSATLLGSSTQLGTLCIYDLSFEVQHEFKLNNGSLWTSEWASDSLKLSLGVSGKALLVDTRTNKFTKVWTNRSDVFYQQFNRQSNILFNGSRDGLIRTVDLRSAKSFYEGSVVSPLQNSSSVSCMKLLKDENYIVSSSIDGFIYTWDRRVGRAVSTIQGFNKELKSIQFTIDNQEQFIFSGGTDNRLRVWNLKTGKQLNAFGPFDNEITTSLYDDCWRLMRDKKTGKLEPKKYFGWFVVWSRQRSFFLFFVKISTINRRL